MCPAFNGDSKCKLRIYIWFPKLSVFKIDDRTIFILLGHDYLLYKKRNVCFRIIILISTDFAFARLLKLMKTLTSDLGHIFSTNFDSESYFLSAFAHPLPTEGIVKFVFNSC